MYSPESYLYETNLNLLATLSDEELADPALIAQLTPSPASFVALAQAIGDVLWSGLEALAGAFAPAGDPDAAAYHYLPYY